MYRNIQQKVLIDIKDLFLFSLKKIGITIFVALIFAGAFFGYKLRIGIKNAESINESDGVNVLDVTQKLPGESDVEYSMRVLNVNRSKDIIESISTLNDQIENQRKYVSDSIIMRIDPENEAITTASLLLSAGDNMEYRVDAALLSTYKQYIVTGEYLNDLSVELGVNQGYLSELITVEYNSASVVVYEADSYSNVGMLSVKVIGTDIEFTDKLMDSVLKNVMSKCIELNNSYGSHSVKLLSRQSSYIYDLNTRERQYNSVSRFENLQQQINGYDKNLDSIASNLGVEKEKIYSNFLFNDYVSTNINVSPYRSAFKYSVIGFILGVLCLFVICSFRYLFGKRFSTQSKFFCRFYQVKKIGVVKPANNRSALSKRIDIESGDDCELTNDNNNKLIARNIVNLTSGMDRVLITGTAEIQRIQNLVKDLDIKADVKRCIFDNPELLDSFSNYDGIIIVEQRNYSYCSLVAKELDYIENSKATLVGAIII